MTEINLFNINLFGDTDSGGSGSGSGGSSGGDSGSGGSGGDYLMKIIYGPVSLFVEYKEQETYMYNPNFTYNGEVGLGLFNCRSLYDFVEKIEINKNILLIDNYCFQYYNNPITFKFKEVGYIGAYLFINTKGTRIHTLDFSNTKSKPTLLNSLETCFDGVDKIICPKSWGWHELDTNEIINFEFTDGTKRPAKYPSVKFKIFAARMDNDVKIISSGNDGEIKNAYIVNDEKAWLYPESGDKNNWILHCEFGQEYDVVIEFSNPNTGCNPLKMIGQSGWWDIENIRWFNNTLRNSHSDIHLASNTIEYVAFDNPNSEFLKCDGGWDDLGDENYEVLNTGGLTLDLTQCKFSNGIDSCLLHNVGYGNSENTIIKVKNDDKVSQWQTAVEYAQAGTCYGRQSMVMLETE